MNHPDLRTAIGRLVELAEWELKAPACPDPPECFHEDLRQAAYVARQFLKAELRPSAGGFFISAPERPRRAER